VSHLCPLPKSLGPSNPSPDRAADNARFDMQTALEEVGKADKIIKRVELEERRARNECDAAEGRIADEELPDDCPFATWSAEMREMMQSNMTKFIKDGGYRQQLDPSQCKGVEDILMMQVLLAKVQIIRDLRELKRVGGWLAWPHRKRNDF
jgi:hypothetical protein